MIDASFVQEIIKNAEVQKFTVNDELGKPHDFTTKGLTEVKAAPPAQPALVKVTTLQGFVDLIGQKISGLEAEQYFIQVENHLSVALLEKQVDVWGRRKRLIEASPVPYERFPFGKWLDQEEFVIAVAAQFLSGGEKDYVLRMAGSVTNDQSSLSEDNGFSQKVTVKAGLSVPTTETIRPIVDLAPYRTFPEVGQPFAQFVFRARTGDANEFALFEADGGKWKVAAINEVARFLRTLSPGVEVVA